LAESKLGIVSSYSIFFEKAQQFFTPYFQPLIHCVDGLRRIFFDENQGWENKDEHAYSRMRQVLQKAMEDPQVAGEIDG
jgi:hypothetical protein